MSPADDGRAGHAHDADEQVAGEPTATESGAQGRASKRQILTQPHATRVGDSSGAVVLKSGDVAFLCDENGDVPFHQPHGKGLFFADCRFLDGYVLRLDDHAPTVLSGVALHGFETRHFLTNPALDESGEVPNNRIAIDRHRVVDDGVLSERITVQSFLEESRDVTLELAFRARFADLFAVKGFVDPPRGRLHRPRVAGSDHVVLRYDGRDGIVRTTDLRFAPPPELLDGDRAQWQLEIAPGAERRFEITIVPSVLRDREKRPARRAPGGLDVMIARQRQRQEDLVARCARLRTSSPLFDRVLDRSLRDLHVLRCDREGLHYYAAGIPWFLALFGRDSIIATLQSMPYERGTARETLELLARHQARVFDDYRDAAPGKILHELRRGELAHLAVIPQSPAYYGTVDATMWFLVLLAEYVRWSGDVDLARRLRPHVERALAWMAGPADSDGDGYLDYSGGEYAHAMVNQGWKDSGNAIVNEDGTLARPPIALCEVQGYAYRAWRQTAALLRVLGDDERADDLGRRADELARRFGVDFWDQALGCFVLARQRDGAPARVVSSNAGQVLWSGIANADQAARVAARLLEDDMFSGWGIRTLSARARAYNPLSYHLGSVWPHDNALIIAGLLRYGHEDAAQRVFAALFDAATTQRAYRLPELFCGHERAVSPEQPVRYPVACSPQAWAAGALPYALSELHGLRPDACRHTLDIVAPTLPSSLEWLELDEVRVGDACVKLRFEAHHGRTWAHADVRAGRLDVAIVGRPAPGDFAPPTHDRAA